MRGRRFWALLVCVLGSLGWVGCQSPKEYRQDADDVAHEIIDRKQQEALGHTEPFTIETPAETLRRRLLGEQNLMVSGPASYGTDRLPPTEHQPEEDYPKPAGDQSPIPPGKEGEVLKLNLIDALQVGARNSREYQSQKESVFQAALDLDLEIDQFRNTYRGLLESILLSDQAGEPVEGVENSGSLELTRRLKSGGTLTTMLAVDLAKLLSSSGASSVGLAADASVTIPLLRGAGRHIVTEPLTQAERNVVYAIWGFERFKREFAVNIVRQYYAVLQVQDQVQNARDSYENQVASTRRTRALAQEDRMSQENLDQARQQELEVRNTWIRAQQNYQNALDNLKLTLGLPTDATLELDRGELDQLYARAQERLQVEIPESTELGAGEVPSVDEEIELEPVSREEGGPYEMPEDRAMHLALKNRLDLRTARERVYDSQRQIYVAANGLKAGLDLTGNASIGQRRSLGSAGLPDAELDPSDGFYSAGLLVDLPFERTAERNAYRDSYIFLEQSTRGFQQLEDQIKQDIRSGLRALVEQRESYKIQVVAEQVARRRVDRTQMLLTLGREGVSTRDVNEAQAALLRAQNAVTASLIDYRLSELELQRDMGLLRVNEKGLYEEFNPDQSQSNET